MKHSCFHICKQNEFILFIFADMEPEVNTRIRQRSVSEFLFKSGDISATVIHSKLKTVYGNETLDRSTIQRWVQRFQTGDFDIRDKARPGRPSSVATDQNLGRVEELVRNNRTITTYQLMENLSSLKEVFLSC